MVRSAVLGMVALAWAGVAGAQEVPTPEQLTEAIREQVPPWWSVRELQIKATANLGDAVEPKIKQRIEAVVAPSADLYAVDPGAQGAFGPFLPLLETLKAGTARTLYAVASSIYAAGRWEIELKLENAVADLGQPVDMFPQPTVVRGSEAEKTLVERLRSDIAALAREDIATAIAEAKTAQAAAIREREQQQAVELERLNTAQAARIAALDADLKKAAAAANGQLEQLKREHEKRLAAMRESQAAEQEQRGKGLEAELAALSEQQAATLAKLDEQHKGEVQRLKREIAQRTELVALETEKQKAAEDLAAAQRVTAENDLAVAKERQAAELAALGESFSARKAQLTKTLEAEIAALKERQTATLAKLEQEHQGEVASVKAEIRQRQELVALEAEKQKVIEEFAAAREASNQRELMSAEQQHKADLEMATKIAAFGAKESAQRQAALDAAIKTGDDTLIIAALEAAFADKDKALRTRALRYAIGSKDLAIRARAVRETLAQAKTIAGTIEGVWKQREKYAGAFGITLDKVEVSADAVNASGLWNGGFFTKEKYQSDKASVTIEGNTLRAASALCSLAAVLGDGPFMAGKMSCTELTLGGSCRYQMDFLARIDLF